MEDDNEKLQAVESIPERERLPKTRTCPTCGGSQNNIGFVVYKTSRFWLYIPGSCICAKTELFEKPIREAQG